MTLGQKQRHFIRLVGLLIEYAYQHGYELMLGHIGYMRPPVPVDLPVPEALLTLVNAEA